MSILGAKIQAGFEPIPGYVLTKRLGSGGYGDVWSADAPGGLKKAIKFVYGTIHEDRASSELKSLQRIRQVNHPFILSLERIEVVEGQLLIVTELAQGSMFDRYLEFRERGFAGIAHDRLLSYLRDAADGLDFLCQKHELQHLDVKPGNLLLVSDRIKVADFGLVKDLHSMSQSLLGGLTPTYAAPEMFDGRPGRYSDQYSLAIVYQEMLTGTLPFRGRTTAQLANEHLNKAPNLESLSIGERPVIAKALAKRPQQRFADCREMVAALEMAMTSTREQSKDNLRVRGWNPKLAPLKPWGARLNNPQPEAGPSLLSKNRIDTAQARNGSKTPVQPFASSNSRSLVIGLGGIGGDVLVELKKRYESIGVAKLDQPQYFSIDTDAHALKNLSDTSNSWSLDRKSVLHTPLKSPHYYRGEIPHFPQLSRRWLYNIPRSQLTEGVRPLGMLAFIDHAHQAYEMLGGLLEELCHEKDRKQPFEVRLVASAMGGTGSAMVCETGFLLRQLAELFQIELKIELILTCAAPSATALGDLASASAISSLIEINHYFKTDGLHPELPRIPNTHSQRPPFDQVKLIYGGQSGCTPDRFESVTQIADYLFLPVPLPNYQEVTSTGESTGSATSSVQSMTSSSNWLSTIRISAFPLEIKVQPEKASTTVFLRNLVAWSKAFEATTKAPKEVANSASLPKILERLDFFVTDSFRICNWNAQAWVRDVMRCIIPDEQPNISDFRSKLQPTACSLEYFQELSAICPPLGLDLSESSISIHQLFECRFEKLIAMLSNWMVSVANWPMVPKLLDLIEERLKVNSNSLFAVAKKLEERYSRLTDSELNRESTSVQVLNEMGRTEVEVIFHKLSGTMLLKFIHRLEKLKTDWTTCSAELLQVLNQFGEQTSQQNLGCSLEAFIQQNLQMKVDSLNRLTVSEFSDLVFRKWVSTCRIGDLFASKEEKRSGDELQPRSASLDQQLNTIFDNVRHEFKKHSTSDVLRSDADKEQSEVSGESDRQSRMSRTLPSKTILRSDLNLSSGSSGQTVGIRALKSKLADESSDSFDLDSKIESCMPYLAEFGDSLRLFLYTSEMIWYQLPDSLQTQIEKCCQVFLSSEKMSSYLVSVGNDLDLEELIDKLWMPTNETWQLVPRVLSRVDIDWLPFSNSGVGTANPND